MVASVEVVVECGSAWATTRVTGVPRVSVAPAGACASTVPAGSLLVCEVTAGRMPNVTSAALASSSFVPVSFGIVFPAAAVPDVVTTVVTLEPLSRCVRKYAIATPATASAITASARSIPEPNRRSGSGGGGGGGGAYGGSPPWMVSTVGQLLVGDSVTMYPECNGCWSPVVAGTSDASSSLGRPRRGGTCGDVVRAAAGGDAEWVRVDVRDAAAVAEALDGVDAVVHTAYRQGER